MLHITRGIKLKNKQTKEVALPESFHKAQLERSFTEVICAKNVLDS